MDAATKKVDNSIDSDNTGQPSENSDQLPEQSQTGTSIDLPNGKDDTPIADPLPEPKPIEPTSFKIQIEAPRKDDPPITRIFYFNGDTVQVKVSAESAQFANE